MRNEEYSCGMRIGMRVSSISYRIPRLLIKFWRHEHRPIIFSRREGGNVEL